MLIYVDLTVVLVMEFASMESTLTQKVAWFSSS